MSESEGARDAESAATMVDDVAPNAEARLVAISMATFNPVPELFERQVESLRAQTHEHWVCVLSDDASNPSSFDQVERIVGNDERFRILRSTTRRGFYRNFEHALMNTPSDAEFVAFADQDDVWHPDKLRSLLTAIRRADAMLAYSDMNIVAPDGTLIASSYWADRRNNYTDLGSLILVNTVSGTASLFRRELLDDALPFPPEVGRQFHDHWMACIALGLGEIVFVDRPLLDYVQHGGNVVGRHEPSAGDFRGGLVYAMRRFVSNPRLRLRNTVTRASGYYTDELIPRQFLARTLEERLAGRLVADKRRIVRRIARMGSSPRSLLWLLARSARDVRGESETLGAENQLVKGVLWHWQDAVRRRVRR
jgi:glycosyltransferase involved in cell wall biosynthesis